MTNYEGGPCVGSPFLKGENMSKRIPVLKDNKECYQIVIENSFDALHKELLALSLQGRKACIVTDTNVGPLYTEQIKAIFEGVCSKVIVHTITAGEENKTLDTVRAVYTDLILEHFDRKDFLVALGGGVVGDLTGYTAATYLRGISFIQIPTTLLAQTDSSIGGKTGVDFDSFKNMVGAFHMPSLVYMNMSTLNTLPGRQFASGMAEVLKHGLIKNTRFYTWLIDNFNEINDKEPDVLEEMIYQSCLVKKEVVEKDPTEQGERALLNFGHTIGHAIEKAKNFELYHGECVALGCIAAAYISYKRQMLSTEECYEIRDMFMPFGLPISVEDVDIEEIIRLTKSDKKVDGNTIKFILLKKVGRAVIDRTVTEDEMRAALKELIFDPCD